MKSGMLTAEACFDALEQAPTEQIKLNNYPQKVQESWLAPSNPATVASFH